MSINGETTNNEDDEFAEYADDPELLEMMKAEKELSKKAAAEKLGKTEEANDIGDFDEDELMKDFEAEVGGGGEDDEAELLKMMEAELAGSKTEEDDEFAEYADDPELLEMMKAEKELSKKASAEKKETNEDDEFAEYADDPELLEMMKAEKELSKKAQEEKVDEEEDPELAEMMRAEAELLKKAQEDEFAEYADDPELLEMMKAEKELSKKAQEEKVDEEEDPELAEMMRAEEELLKKAKEGKSTKTEEDDEFAEYADDPEMLEMLKAEKALAEKAKKEKPATNDEDEFAEFADDPEMLEMLKAEKALADKAKKEKKTETNEDDEFAEFADDPEMLEMLKAEKALADKAKKEKKTETNDDDDEFAEFADDPEMLEMLKAEKALTQKAKKEKATTNDEDDEFAEFADDPEMLEMLKAEKALTQKAKAKASGGDDEDEELAEMIRQEKELAEKAKRAKKSEEDDDPELAEMLRQERELAEKAKKGKPTSSGDDDELRQMEEELANLANAKKPPPMKKPDDDDDDSDDGAPMQRGGGGRGGRGGPPSRGGPTRGTPPPVKPAVEEDDEDDGAPMQRGGGGRGGGPSRGGPPTRGTPTPVVVMPIPEPEPEPEPIKEPEPQFSGFDELRRSLLALEEEEEAQRKRRLAEEEEEIRRQYMGKAGRKTSVGSSPSGKNAYSAYSEPEPNLDEFEEDDLLSEFEDKNWKGADVQLTEWETVMGQEGGFVLEDLLGMSCDFITTLQNERVLYPDFYDYFIQPDVITQLVSYIVDNSKDNTLAGAALAVLTANLSEINTALARSHLPTLFKVYETNERLHTLRANALTKLFKILLLSSEYKRLVAFLKPPNITANLLKHAYCPFIGEFFIALVTHQDIGTIAMRLLVSVKFIENCVGIMNNSELTHVHPALSDHLRELVDVLPFDSPIIQSLCNQVNVMTLFQTMLSSTESVSKYGPQVYLHLLAAYTKQIQEMGDARPPLDTQLDDLHVLIREPVKNFDKMVLKLSLQENEKKIEDLAHNWNNVFGYSRLNVLDMIDLLLQSDFYIVIDTLMEERVNFFPASFQCLQDFSHSSFCHKFVESIFQQCFVAQPADIILKILQSVNFPAEIIAMEEKSQELQKTTGYPLQYMTYLRNIAYALQKILTIANDPALLDHIELCPGWTEYVQLITDLKIRASKGADKPLAPVAEATNETSETPVNFEDLDETSLDDMLSAFEDPK